MSGVTLFPIGQYGGTAKAERLLPEDHLVRVGRTLEQLDDDSFGVWVLAHGTAEVGKDCWTRDAVVDRARAADIADAGASLDRLLDRGLVTTVPVGTGSADDAVAFAEAYQVRALLVGLGAAPEEPDQHAVGVPGVGTAALLDSGSFQLWQWSTAERSLWQLCQRRVGTTGSVTLDALVDPVDVLAGMLGELRVLLAHGCVYLDVVPSGSEPAAATAAGAVVPG